MKLAAARPVRIRTQDGPGWVLDEGASVVHAGPHGTVLAYERPVSHLAHAVGTLVTGGLWVVVWLVCAIARSEDRVRLECDPWGHVWALRATSR